jgi:hypothetical protein
MTIRIPPGPPLTPTVAGARAQLHSELVKPQYQAARPTLFDQVLKAITDWFESLGSGGGQGVAVGPGLILTVIGVVVVLALVIGFLIFGVPRLNRRSRVSGTLFGEQDDRTSVALRRAADTAAASGDFATAIEEGFRSIARGLAERGIITTYPGTTAHGFAALAIVPFPDSSQRLEHAADLFDGVRYLGVSGTESGWLLIRDLEQMLSRARPRLDESLVDEALT